MTPESRKHLHAIFDAHSEALRAMREVNQQIEIANNAFTAMVHAHDDAITAALSANQAALDLLESLEGGDR